MMIVVGFDKELREAFAAGQASVMYLLGKTSKSKDMERFYASVPKTYEEWIESIADRPQVPIG